MVHNHGDRKSPKGWASKCGGLTTGRMGFPPFLYHPQTEMQLGASDVEIVIGPTEHAVLPLSFEVGCLDVPLEVRING